MPQEKLHGEFAKQPRRLHGSSATGKDACTLLEPPSKQLQRLLSDLKLCSAKDLRRCRRRIRRLAPDLPAFDSIWIDALVQARKLTSFQAKVLESKHPERLRVGPCLLVDRLGKGLTAETFLARRLDGNERCVLKQIEFSSETVRQIETNLTELISGVRGIAHPSVAAPHAFNRMDRGRVVAISRYVPGPHLSELVVRRGRFPAAVVLDIGRQLLDGLSALETRGLVHGDIRPSNVRLTSAGVAVLVDAGIGPAIRPELTIHADVPPERHDGIAPELIGTGNRPNSDSDLYAVGCLLWQLLAGRPPFPTGDPLAKLAAHQTRAIQDVRQWAPDTPPYLAEAIQWFTMRDPSQRPQSAREALMQWGPPRRSDRKRLARFHVMFETSVPRVPDAAQSSRSRWTVLLVGLFVLSGAALTLLDHGAQSQFLRIVSKVVDSLPTTGRGHEIARPGEADRSDSTFTEQLRPIPAPNAEGVIQLDPQSSYLAAEISTVGPLLIRSAATPGEPGDATANRLPEIVVTDAPLKVWAEQLTVDGVQFRRQSKSPIVPSALLLVQAQNVAIRKCRFRTHQANAASPSPQVAKDPVAVAWKPLDPHDHSGCKVIVKDSVFTGNGSVVEFAGLPHDVRCSNCLKVGAGAFLSLARDSIAQGDISVKLQSITLRQSDALLRLTAVNDPPNAIAADTPNLNGHVVIEANDCVFDLNRSSAALFEWIGKPPPADWLKSIAMNGEGCLANAELIVAAWKNQTTGTRTVLETDGLQLEGISTGPFEFAGRASSNAWDSRIKSDDAPSRSPDPPGIDASRLPLQQGQKNLDRTSG